MITAITNVGRLVTGNIMQPVLDSDTILIENGKIARIGMSDSMDLHNVDKILDVSGMVVCPGLIDSHVHVAIGDFTPRKMATGYIETSVHGGTTTMISAGEAHIPGRPKDPVGVKAGAILVSKSFRNFRPGGVKVHGGAVILEKGLTERDFKEMAEAGVWLIGEIGIGSVQDPDEAAEMVKWAREYGFKVMMHSGGTSVPGSAVIGADAVMKVNPDVVSHINGGPTAMPIKDAEKLVKQTKLALELVECGNPRMAVEVIKMAKENDALHRILVGNDAPSGTGLITLGILRMLALISSLGAVAAPIAIAMATGNTARVYQLGTGTIEQGKEADILVIDRPVGSSGNDALEAIQIGDLPGIAMVMIDGDIKILDSAHTAPPVRKVQVKKG